MSQTIAKLKFDSSMTQSMLYRLCQLSIDCVNWFNLPAAEEVHGKNLLSDLPLSCHLHK